MASDLEALASKGKQQRSKRQRDKLKAARKQLKGNKPSVLKASLRDSKFMFYVYGLVVLLVVPAIVNALMFQNESLTVPLMAGGLALAVGGFFWLKDYALRKEVAWVANLDIGLDPESYLRSLDRELGDNGSMTVEVEFTDPVDDEAGKIIADAALGASDASSSRFNGTKLIVVSKSLETRFWARTEDRTTIYSSHRLLHHWFKKLTKDGLLAIHQRHPIAKMNVQLKKA